MKNLPKQLPPYSPQFYSTFEGGYLVLGSYNEQHGFLACPDGSIEWFKMDDDRFFIINRYPDLPVETQYCNWGQLSDAQDNVETYQ